MVGAEADFQGSDQTDTACVSPICAAINEAGVVNGAEAQTIEQQLTSFATMRGRGGLVFNNFYLYVTGGGAWGQLKETDTFTVNNGTGSTIPVQIVSSQFTANKVGPVVGGGVEGVLWGNWTAKVEYLYLNLGSVSNTYNFLLATNTTPVPFTVATTSTIRDHVFRAGLNYRLGGP